MAQGRDVEKAFKKYDDLTALIAVALGVPNVVIPFFLDKWRFYFVPIFALLIVFYVILRTMIILEDNPLKSFRLRLILWFGLIFIGINPPIFFASMVFTFWLRGPIILPDYPVPSGSIFGPLALIPSAVIFGCLFASYKASSQIGLHLIKILEKKKTSINLKMRALCNHGNYFSSGNFSKAFIVMIILYLSLLYSFIMSTYYDSVVNGNFASFGPAITLSSSLFVFLAVFMSNLFVFFYGLFNWKRNKLIITMLIAIGIGAIITIGWLEFSLGLLKQMLQN